MHDDVEFPPDIAEHAAGNGVSCAREVIDLPPEKFTDEDDTETTDRYVGCVVENAREEVLLVKHGDDPDRDGWVIPGGAVEPGESLPEAARREIAEEAGIDCRIRRPARVIEQEFRNEANPAQSETGYFVLFVATAESEAPAVAPERSEEEVVAAEWFDAVPENSPQPDLIASFLD